jgi:enolase
MKMPSVEAIEIRDSGGNPTVEAELTLKDGTSTRAMVPGGASDGEREACEMREADKKHHGDKDVLKAVENVSKIITKKIAGRLFINQRELDYFMIEPDGTENKSKPGANEILAENDWSGWKNLTQVPGNKIEIAGDNLFCTNKAILVGGIKKGIANLILIKLNQTGTVTETPETTEPACKSKDNALVSHRIGEKTPDGILADFTVAENARHLKTEADARVNASGNSTRLSLPGTNQGKHPSLPKNRLLKNT